MQATIRMHVSACMRAVLATNVSTCVAKGRGTDCLTIGMHIPQTEPKHASPTKDFNMLHGPSKCVLQLHTYTIPRGSAQCHLGLRNFPRTILPNSAKQFPFRRKMLSMHVVRRIQLCLLGRFGAVQLGCRCTWHLGPGVGWPGAWGRAEHRWRCEQSHTHT